MVWLADWLVGRAETKMTELIALGRSCTLPSEPDAGAVDELLRSVTRAWEAGRA